MRLRVVRMEWQSEPGRLGHSGTVRAALSVVRSATATWSGQTRRPGAHDGEKLPVWDGPLSKSGPALFTWAGPIKPFKFPIDFPINFQMLQVENANTISSICSKLSKLGMAVEYFK
jgi:hypothetical protein